MKKKSFKYLKKIKRVLYYCIILISMSDSEQDIISKFNVWPTSGEKPLRVAFIARLEGREGEIPKSIWTLENGKKIIEKNWPVEKISYVYREPGSYNENLLIRLMKQGGEHAGTRDFTITVTKPEEEESPENVDVIDNLDGISSPNVAIEFTATIGAAIGPGAIESFTWNFGDDTGEIPWDKMSFEKKHAYKEAGNYTGEITVKIKGIDRVSKRKFYIMII